MRCRHCCTRKVTRPRGLCWRCYYTPGVNELYPSTSKHARRGVGNDAGGYSLPAHPTRAPAGTEEKVRVLAERAEVGVSLFHPRDGETSR